MGLLLSINKIVKKNFGNSTPPAAFQNRMIKYFIPRDYFVLFFLYQKLQFEIMFIFVGYGGKTYIFVKSSG